jgi:hypothetical protein
MDIGSRRRRSRQHGFRRPRRRSTETERAATRRSQTPPSAATSAHQLTGSLDPNGATYGTPKLTRRHEIHPRHLRRQAGHRKPVISFEFFPPKTDEGDRSLFEKQIPALLAARPDFCSVTYGAGGSTRDKTLMIVDRIQRQHGLTALAHLTCVNHTREEVRALLEKIRALELQKHPRPARRSARRRRIPAHARRL